jgi:hypothetical protein
MGYKLIYIVGRLQIHRSVLTLNVLFVLWRLEIDNTHASKTCSAPFESVGLEFRMLLIYDQQSKIEGKRLLLCTHPALRETG